MAKSKPKKFAVKPAKKTKGAAKLKAAKAKIAKPDRKSTRLNSSH